MSGLKNSWRRRDLKRAQAKAREVSKFIQKTIPPSREVFLRCRAEYLYCERRLGVLNQNPDRHHSGIEDLQKIKSEILNVYPDIAADLREEDLVPSRLEL
jgi:hypothetical protein